MLNTKSDIILNMKQVLRILFSIFNKSTYLYVLDKNTITLINIKSNDLIESSIPTTNNLQILYELIDNAP